MPRRRPHAVAAKPAKRGSRLVLHAGSEFTADELEFLKAIDQYKREKCRPHPTYTEILDVLRSLGWRKT